MLLPRFDYLNPATIEDAGRLLKEHEPNARLVAGGTELFPRMKQRLTSPETLISLKEVKVQEPSVSRDRSLILSALMSLTSLTRSSAVLEKAPLLAEAAKHVASNEIRNMGTLGGNLCQESRCLYYNQHHGFQFIENCFKRGGSFCYFIPKGKKCVAVYMSDSAPALMCLDAKIKIVGTGIERELPIGDLFTGDAKNPFNITSREILAEVTIPLTDMKEGWAFQKLTLRGGLEFGGLNVAVVLRMKDGARTCKQARIAVGAVSAAPARATGAESRLEGKSLTTTLLDEAAQAVADEIRITPHHGYSHAFLKEALRTHTRRALYAALERAG